MYLCRGYLDFINMKTKLLSRFNSLLVMLLTALGFSGCFNQGAYGSPYVSNKIIIDDEAGTVNGTPYDNKTKKCWEVTTSITYPDHNAKTMEYYWGTEFDLVVSYEVLMYQYSSSGYQCWYRYEWASEYKDSESCLANNETN